MKRGELVENLGGLIWLIIVVVSIIARAQNKSKKQQQNQQYKDVQSTPKKTTLQSQLNQVMNQISEIKTAAIDQAKQSLDVNANTRSIQSQPTRLPSNQSSLEGTKVEGFQVEGFQMEGTQVEGTRMEGTKVEGLSQMHSTLKFSKNKKAVTESSMKSGFAGEGCDEHYDMEIAYSKNASTGKPIQTLRFSDNPIIQGVVMAQILERPKR
ncbi:MAG: hypothetical protein AB1Z23_06680 [Eubacteriales bacterium]